MLDADRRAFALLAQYFGRPVFLSSMQVVHPMSDHAEQSGPASVIRPGCSPCSRGDQPVRACYAEWAEGLSHPRGASCWEKGGELVCSAVMGLRGRVGKCVGKVGGRRPQGIGEESWSPWGLDWWCGVLSPACRGEDVGRSALGSGGHGIEELSSWGERQTGAGEAWTSGPADATGGKGSGHSRGHLPYLPSARGSV